MCVVSLYTFLYNYINIFIYEIYATNLKMFPGTGYLRSEDGVV